MSQGQPVDLNELEGQRLLSLANSISLALSEGFGDLVDTREWQHDDPSFGMGRAGQPLLCTSVNDRDDGRFLPVYQTEADLRAIRGEARSVMAMSGSVSGAIHTLANYTLGKGMKFTVQKSANCPARCSPAAINRWARQAQQVLDRFMLQNRFPCDMDREIDGRCREDGEAFLELSVLPTGQIKASFDEPDMICQPGDPHAIEDWLHGNVQRQRGVEGEWSWSFGVHSLRRTPDDPQGYHVVYDSTGDDWDYVPVERMLHVKRNVPRNAKRGVSDLYWVANDVQRELKIRRNTADAAALQSAIAWIREHLQGTTPAAIQGMLASQSIGTRFQKTSTGTRPTRLGKLNGGTVIDIPEGMRYLPGPMGCERNPNFILIAQYVNRAIATRWAMPEAMFASDASNANYASSLVAESPFVKAREADQRFYASAFVELMWKVLRLAHQVGRFAPDVARFDLFQDCLTIAAEPPQVDTRDEVSLVQRQKLQMEMGILSPRTAAAQAGLDYDREQVLRAQSASGESTAECSRSAGLN